MRIHRARVRHEQQNIDPFNGSCDFAHHLFVQRGFAFMQSWRIDEDDLPLFIRHDSLDAVASRLRFRRDDGDFLADEAIEQGGFSGIRASDYGDETSTFFRFASCSFWFHSTKLCDLAARDFFGFVGTGIFFTRSFSTFVWLASRTSKWKPSRSILSPGAG